VAAWNENSKRQISGKHLFQMCESNLMNACASAAGGKTGLLNLPEITGKGKKKRINGKANPSPISILKISSSG
jgi:hypothetical protein